ncbi:MAG TPA: hypothetical protein VJ995_04115 [Geothermobacteraceae bacterium]|nr:hypothetical protein [Geothermobacteraceae bacterium]
MDQPIPMTEDSVRDLLEAAGARVASRGGRSENYGAAREFTFEVKGVFANGLMVHVVARQYNYRDPWEAEGRVNDLVDVALLRDGNLTSLPKGEKWFQGVDEEIGIELEQLREIITTVATLNPKVLDLQKLTGDL